ncbi:GNAT family N-acetyltransferase [Neolewinella persica]|uniref:GNAT family N-acetyltransferase n=1 Tax=Neolewinella persica TaxID=70998 RepID=UPI00036AE9DB|nr:GNAT family protein [Neolewinella persica]
MEVEELATCRLKLRKLTPEVFDYIYRDFSEKKQLAFLGLKSTVELKVEKNKYEKGLWTHNKRFLYFQLLDQKCMKIIGWCGYHTWYLDHERAEIGYGLFDDKYKRKGLMSEAMYPIIEYGFKQMRLNRIEAFIGPKNEASIKLINKFNFVKEGQLREHYRENDRAEDSIVYSLLRKEYENC